MDARCPLRMDPNDNKGCCSWSAFLDDFLFHWPRWFDAPPTLKHWQTARRDWRKGNTGFEAAHNAQADAKKAAAKAAAPKLVHLGGRNYTHDGSVIHQKHLALIQKGEE